MLLHYFKLPDKDYKLILKDNILIIGESKYDLRQTPFEQFNTTGSKNTLFFDD